MSDLESQALEMMAGGDQTEAADKPDSNQKESEETAIKRLASLSPIDYDRSRKAEAEKRKQKSLESVSVPWIRQ